MKFVVIPDSFKGTISSIRASEIIAEAINRHCPSPRIVKIPVADGGEGTVDCFLAACGGRRVAVRVTGPLGNQVDSFYGVLEDGTAVVEMAAAAGLPMVGDRPDPLGATTYGAGELVRHAIAGGARKVIVGLGGSATTDAGCGFAAALGAVFRDPGGALFVPTGGTLEAIRSLDVAPLKETLSGVSLTAMCDIDNPLYGPRGAAFVYAPQKGAADSEVDLLDRGLVHAAKVFLRDAGTDVSGLPGGGAAGGMGAGLYALCGAELKMGIETVLDTVGFTEILRDADLVITGEGKIDSQSLSGKVVSGIARRCAAGSVPLIAVVGDVGEGAEAAYGQGVTAIFSINRVAVPFSEARKRSERDLAATMDDLFRFARIWRQ